MSDTSQPTSSKSEERNVFLFTTAVLIPALAVGIVGGYGFTIWIYQMLVRTPYQ